MTESIKHAARGCFAMSRPPFNLNCVLNCPCRSRDCVQVSEGIIRCARWKWVLALLILLMFECYYSVVAHHKMLNDGNRIIDYIDKGTTTLVTQNTTVICYKYLLNNSVEVSMDFKNGYNSSYYWFMAMKHLFTNLGYEDSPKYLDDTPYCQLNESSMGPIKVNKTEPRLEWVEQQNPDVKLGGYFAPAHCRAKHRVAILVPYRDRRTNLAIFLRYIHPLLKKQLLEYRIFVIEQYGTEQFNKGTLYNIAFLEIQRFGSWQCLIFHDVDLIPEDERISYTCQKYPTHMSPAVESHGYVLAYASLFGGVTSLTPEQYTAVNGYSNFYWSWGAEDDDMYVRLKSANLPMWRYNAAIARYATLPHKRNPYGKHRYFFLDYSKLRFRKEGLTSTRYKLMKVTKEKLYTHLLADVNPIRMRLDLKSMLRQIVYLFNNSMTYAGAEVDDDRGALHVDEQKSLTHIKL